MAQYLLSLDDAQITHLAKVIEAVSARDILGAGWPVSQYHESDLGCAREVQVCLYYAAQSDRLTMINIWCILWPRDESLLPAGALAPSVLARNWPTAHRKYAGSGGGYACTRIALKDDWSKFPGPFVTALAINEHGDRDFITWMLENTPPCVDESREWDAHDAKQWSDLIACELQTSPVAECFDIPMLTLDEDQVCAYLVHRCPARLKADALTRISGYGRYCSSALVSAHVISAHQTSAAIQTLLDRETYERALTFMWHTFEPNDSVLFKVAGSAIQLAVQSRSWPMAVHLARTYRWRAAAVAGAIFELEKIMNDSERYRHAETKSVREALALSLSQSIDAVDGHRPAPGVRPVPIEEFTCDMLRDAMWSDPVNGSAPSYAHYIDAVVTLEMQRMANMRPYDASPLVKHASDISTPNRVRLLVAAAVTGSADTISVVKHVFRLSLPLDMLLNTSLVPSNMTLYAASNEQHASVFQACGCHSDDTEDDVMCALFSRRMWTGRHTDTAHEIQDRDGGGGGGSGGGGGGRGDGDGGGGGDHLSAERLDVSANVGPRKLDVIRQAIRVQSVHGLAWAVKLPANNDEEETTIERLLMDLWTCAGFKASMWHYKALQYPGLVLHMVRLGSDPFKTVGDQFYSDFEHAVFLQWSRPSDFKRNVGPPLAFRMAVAHAYHRHTSMAVLFRHKHVRRAFSRAMSYALQHRVFSQEHHKTMLAAIASLSNWRVWGPAAHIDPVQSLSAAYDGVLRDYDEACVYSVFVLSGGVMTTSFSEQGREAAAPAMRWGDVPFEHDRMTRAKVVAALVVLSRPRARTQFIATT